MNDEARPLKASSSSQAPAAAPPDMLDAEPSAAPPPSYSQATSQPKPLRQLSLPGDEPSHPSHRVLSPGTPSRPINGAGYPGAAHGSYHGSGGQPVYAGQDGAQSGGVWSPPPNDEVGKARGRRRFFVALLWAVAIYMLIGMLIGGGIEDGQRERHRDWDRDGHRHQPDRPVFTRTWRRLPTATVVQPVPPPSEKTPRGDPEKGQWE